MKYILALWKKYQANVTAADSKLHLDIYVDK